MIGMTNAQAGWYDDGSGRTRYWDGVAWTEHFAPTDPIAGTTRHDHDGKTSEGAPVGSGDMAVTTAREHHEFRTVWTIRGTEALATAKWLKKGWEVDTQHQGKLRTEIKLRRRKTNLPWRLFAVLGGALLLVAIAVVIGVNLSGGTNADAEAAPAASAHASSPTATEEPEPNEAASSEAAPRDPVAPQTITPENNPEFAALLTGPSDGDSVEAFAEKYQGQLIAFDGSIGAMALHGDNKTRYDILISFGDYNATRSSGGPNFQFRDVNAVYDLHLIGDNVPDSIGVGDDLRILAQVGAYEPESLLFLLKPVSTGVR